MNEGKIIDHSHCKKKLFINTKYPKTKKDLDKKKGPIVARNPAGGVQNG